MLRRHRLRDERLARGEHARTVDGDAGRNPFGRTGREQYVRGFDEALVLTGHRDAVRTGESPAPAHQRDRVLLEQGLHALAEPVGGLAAVVDGLAVVESQLARDDAEGLAVIAQRIDQLGAREQRLRRNAAPVQAHAAGPVLLDHGNALPELRGADRGDVAARSGTDDREIESIRHSPRNLLSGSDANGPDRVESPRARCRSRPPASGRPEPGGRQFRGGVRRSARAPPARAPAT